MKELKVRGYYSDNDGVTFILIPKSDDGTYFKVCMEWSYLKKIIKDENLLS
jgi:hypothetical protein